MLLLTNDGEFKRQLELPSTGVTRHYRARAFGTVSQAALEDLSEGVTIEGMRYGSIDANLERRTGRNCWIQMSLTEGKNREVRRVLEHLGLQVSRLIRTGYGPFDLAGLDPGGVAEVDRNRARPLPQQPQVRIIAGEWRGRRLQAPPGMATRPTADRVRETLFSMLASRLGSFEGLRVADLFAGSGALGLEALSRGAAFACFVENDAKAAAAIKANAIGLGALDRVQILGGSALALPKSEPFDLVFADPPYAPGSGTAAVARGRRCGLARAGRLDGGRNRAQPTRSSRATWTIDATRNVGRAKLTLLRSA